MSAKKERVDVLLVERGLIETREKAKRAIMAGLVYANEMRLISQGENPTRYRDYGEGASYAVCKPWWL